MKTKEELNALKEEVETLNKKLAELSEEELKQVVGGTQENTCPRGKTEMDQECKNCSETSASGLHLHSYTCDLGIHGSIVVLKPQVL